MKIYLVQIWERYRGSVWVEVRTIPGDTADTIAQRATLKGLALLNARWPGLLPGEAHVTGITDGRRTLQADGSPSTRPPVPVTAGDPHRRAVV